MTLRCFRRTAALLCAASLFSLPQALAAAPADLEQGFSSPPDSAKPWVYWFVMDGNLSREGITADFEAMKEVGLGGLLFMEVDVGIPKGPVKFMSPPWRDLFKHANQEAARLGLVMTMPASPGWTGSGGPWVKPAQSMQKLVSSETNLAGPRRFEGLLAQPQTVAGFYRDVAVLAFPTPSGTYRIPDLLEKAVFHRGHYSSESGVKAVLSAAAGPGPAPEAIVRLDRIMDLTAQLDSQGRLAWDVPAGSWTVLRWGHTSTGANTRPAPEPGVGLECDKFDRAALDAHFHDFLGKLLEDLGPLAGRSLVALHIDSWEMGPQNWTARFREEFQRRRGYELLRYLPIMTGRVVESLEGSERFLWDLRQTILELITENHAGHLAALAHQHGLQLSIEPYDGTPCDDMTYGARADTPMGEFWRDTFSTWFSCTEATSIAHTYGRRVIQAEAFTSGDGERWLAHPATLKTLGDWAFCEGINRFVFHRYAHQPWLDRWPGMTMGPYGIHYERTQTWWDLSRAWIQYLTRCQFLLQQGLTVADVCFLKPEASPQVFRAPASATRGNPPERLGYSFDGCNPEVVLTRMTVQNGRLLLPDGMSYRLLVLPQTQTMTPALLRKVKELVQAGATVIGPRPLKSPSLTGYPRCDAEVQQLAAELFPPASPAQPARPPASSQSGSGSGADPGPPSRRVGLGQVFCVPGLEDTATSNREVQNPLAGARWIWHREGNPAAAAPVATRYFRRLLTLPAEASLESALLFMTADNTFETWVNGRAVGTGDSFKRITAMDLTPLLRPGTNLLAVAAHNGGTTPNPAGLVGTLRLKYRDGRRTEVCTDRQWQTSITAPDRWSTDLAAGATWGTALELGAFGMAPWGSAGQEASQPEMFCDFGVVSKLLGQLGVPPDFESDGPFRYGHRRADGTDLYFVANREERWAGAQCAFRVSGQVPELWDPRTGQIKPVAVYQERDGRTLLPLWLEPAGSVFVVFRKPAALSAARRQSPGVVALTLDGQNVLPEAHQRLTSPAPLEIQAGPADRLTLLAWQAGRYELTTTAGQKLAGAIGALPAPQSLHRPWEVRFQPNRGAPEKLVFEMLSDWSRHPDPGVKYFSGVATYTTTFVPSAESLPRPSATTGPGGATDPSGPRLYLDLGQVAALAQVRLNGHDLGILWKEPFVVDITTAVQPRENTLEIKVANLWPNRLIGDQGRPADQRIASTTWNPFRKDTPLLPSGLLGPVTLRSALSRQIPP